MIKIIIPVPPFNWIKKKEIWFAEKPNPLGILNSFYSICAYEKPMIGYTTIPYYTKIIDLATFTGETLLQSFHKSCIYKIRRAEREGVSFHIENSFDKFESFYNEFAKEKGLPAIEKKVRAFKTTFFITKATFNEEVIVMHSYIVDKKIGRAFMHHSASLFRDESDSGKRNIIGMANRFLHYMDMVYFLKRGYKTYDLGGYGYKSDAPEIQGINRFKDEFNGRLVREHHYYPFWRGLYKTLQKRLNRNLSNEN